MQTRRSSMRFSSAFLCGVLAAARAVGQGNSDLEHTTNASQSVIGSDVYTCNNHGNDGGQNSATEGGVACTAGDPACDCGDEVESPRVARAAVNADEASFATAKQDEGQRQTTRGEEPTASGLPEVIVESSRVLNVDIKRSMDDAQPYVVFDRKMIERSSANNLEDFFRNELTMNVSSASAAQQAKGGSKSSINLRGLGSDETLILVDGRRLAQFGGDIQPQQPDINGIPLAAVERIEVLPATASGIYGGGATGGVINVVLRRNYNGLETTATYGNTFGSDAASRRIDMSGGFNFEDGRTNLLIAGSYSDVNALLEGERNLVLRGRRHILLKDPDFYYAGLGPPLGSTPNICSSTEWGICDGAPLVLDNGVSLGSSVAFVPRGYAGAMTDGGAALASTAGGYNLDLPNTAQTEGRMSGLASIPTRKSLIATVRREFTPRVRAFVDIQASDTSTVFPYNGSLVDTAVIPADAPTNPFQQTIQVSFPAMGLDDYFRSKIETHRASTGAIVQLNESWHAETDFTWNRSTSTYVQPAGLADSGIDAIDSGLLDMLRDQNRYPVELASSALPAATSSPSEGVLRNVSLRLTGLLPFSLPGGALNLSSLIEHRRESMGEVILSYGENQFQRPSRSQSVNSAYLELTVPFVTRRNRMPGIELLDVQLAARHDAYNVRGASGLINLSDPTPVTRVTNRQSSTDPTVGLRYRPVEDVTIRASYGTGFLPPSMSGLVANFPRSVMLPFLTDPLRGNEPLRRVWLLSGGNPSLESEQSESWSAGIIFTPQWAPALRVSADWSRVLKTGNIGALFLTTQAGLNGAISTFPERISREPASDGYSVGRIAGLDDTSANLARLQVESLDLALDYEYQPSRFGTFDFSLRASHLIASKSQATAGSPLIENAGVLPASDKSAGGLRWQTNATVNWTYQGWSVGWKARFFDSYYLDAAHTVYPEQGSATVPSQTYHDVFGSYSFGFPSRSALRALADTEIRFGVNNVFNKMPPVDVVSVAGMYYSPLGDPRMANYYLSVKKSF